MSQFNERNEYQCFVVLECAFLYFNNAFLFIRNSVHSFVSLFFSSVSGNFIKFNKYPCSRSQWSYKAKSEGAQNGFCFL